MGIGDREAGNQKAEPASAEQFVDPDRQEGSAPNPRKILVLSDTHIPTRATAFPGKVVEALREADLILHAGDLATPAVLDELRNYGKPVVAVRGNVDVPELRLPRRAVIPIGRFKIGMIHGDGATGSTFGRAAAAFAEEPVQIVVFGHSHQPLLKEENGRFYLNPGSPTDKHREPRYSFAWIYVEDDGLRPELVYF